MRSIALALMAVGVVAAQAVDRTKPPATPPLRDFKLPPTQDSTLANGLRIVLVQDSRYPMVELRMGFQAGRVFDPPELPGLSEAVAALLDEGTSSRSAKKLAEEGGAIGGEIGVSSSSDFITLTAYAPDENFAKLLDLVADMVLNANFPDDEVRLRKQNRLQELADERSQPEQLGVEKLRHVLFGGHPYSKTLPTAASIEKMTRDDMVRFRDRHLRPNNSVLVMVGPFVDTKVWVRMVEVKFGNWQRGADVRAAAVSASAAKRSITLVDRPGSVQAAVQVGRLGVPRSHADYFPLMVASTILGGGTSSRLFNDIREKQGFAYHVSSHSQPFKQAGMMEGVMQVRNEVVEPAVASLLGHFSRMGTERVAQEELSDVKNYLSGKFVMSLARPSGVADQLLASRMNGLGNAYLETYVNQIRRVEPDQIQGVSKRYMDPQGLAVVVVGDAKAILKPLEKAGPVKVEKAN